MSEPMVIVDRLRHVHEDTDRHGNVRIYFWRGRGHRKIRIRAQPGTPEFRSAYAAAEAEDTLIAGAPVEEPRSPSARPLVPGTWRWLCTRYFAECADYLRCAPSTRTVRRRVLEQTFLEPIAPGSPHLFADFPLARMTAKAVMVLRDRKREVPEAANARLKAIRRVFRWAIETGIDGLPVNPARDVGYFRQATDGHHTWTDEEVARFEARHPPGTKAHLALALLMYTGARRSDVVLFGRQMIRDGWLTFVETKGRGQTIKRHEMPVLPELQAAIEAGPTGHLTFLVTGYGKPFTTAGFGNWFRDRCDEAGLAHCSAHGLRKAGATRAAENGATEHQLMAIFGWTSPQQAAVYTRKARRRILAAEAIHLLRPRTEGERKVSHPNPPSEPGEKIRPKNRTKSKRL
jgi:integrase